MGAIAGIVYPQGQAADAVVPMLDIMEHRCQCPSEIFRFQTIEIGACRGAHWEDREKKLFAALDGSFYNEKALRKEIQEKGVVLSGDSLGELLVCAYHLWGVDCFSKLEGDFGLVVVDLARHELVLARDKIGKKPLYWFHDTQHFIFGSELKALLTTGIIPKTPAMDAFAAYISLGYCPQDMTPIRGVSKLLPAHYLVLKQNHQMVIRGYWSYSACFMKAHSDSPEVTASTLDERLVEAVKKRLVKDEPLACMLSGGLGSSSIAYYVNHLRTSHQVLGFTVGFENAYLEDRQAATAVAKTLQIPQVVETINSSTWVQDFAKIVWHLDEPLADPNVMATWRLSHLVAVNADCVFSGMGCDELFAGHTRYRPSERSKGSSFLKELWQKSVVKFLIPWLKWTQQPKAYAYLRESHIRTWQADYLLAHTTFDQTTLAEAMPKLRGLFDPLVFLQKFHQLNRIPSKVASLAYLDLKTRLPDQFILQVERLTAAFALKWRAPYLDTALIEYVAPVLSQTEREASLILKRLFRGRLPEEVVQRPKERRPVFLQPWARDPNIVQAFDLLQTGHLVGSGILSKTWLERQLSSEERRSQAFHELWSLLSLEVWFRIFISKPISRSAPDIPLLTLLRE